MYQAKERENNKLKEENKKLDKDIGKLIDIGERLERMAKILLRELQKVLERSEFINAINSLGFSKEDKQDIGNLDIELNPQYYPNEVQEQRNEPKRNKGMTR